jgi:Flp pilus assembly protein TadB
VIQILAALTVGGGLALSVVAVLRNVRDRDEELAKILALPYGEHDVDITAVTESRAALFEQGVSLAQQGLERLNLTAGLNGLLERARVPLRPGEFVLSVLGGGAGLGLAAWLLTGQALLAILLALPAPWLGRAYLNLRFAKRRKKFEAQLPEALSLIASSLQAGHTFLRSIQVMCQEFEAPLSEEFERVVAETGLGDPVVDSLERLAQRMDLPDLSWVVQAIRIQQTVGGKLADLLFTLADFMRAREEVRREVKVLTAEGRLSAYILGALPVITFVAVQILSPGYMDPLLQGWGLAVMAGVAGMVATGVTVIKRMARVDV